LERLRQHKARLEAALPIVKEFALDGRDIQPEEIKLELREIERPYSSAAESRIFFWWNLMWWSLPFEAPVGRQMRYLAWDTYHDAPFGLLLLQSPSLRMNVRDKYLGICKENLDYWINQSLYAQRVGALPPYNRLLGAKMMALSLVAEELRMRYEQKYNGTRTIIRGRNIPAKLLFVSTTGAYGKSSVYDRLRFEGESVCSFLGYTAGSGTFHVSDRLFEEIIDFLESNKIDTTRGYGSGPSRKRVLIHQAFKLLNLRGYYRNNIRRGFYLFPHAKNLKQIIQDDIQPEWISHPFQRLFEYWKTRWCIPRSQNTSDWRTFSSRGFINRAMKHL
jgi:hypothetical protein